jgi:hypothetical protein
MLIKFKLLNCDNIKFALEFYVAHLKEIKVLKSVNKLYFEQKLETVGKKTNKTY